MGDEKKKKRLDRPVLADGEHTGHAHVLDDPTVEVFVDESGVREFTVDKDTALVHQEHNPITIHPNAKGYESDRVVEADPFEGERRVTD